MVDKIQAIRGMNDILPQQTQYWQRLEQLLKACLDQYGYQEIRFPIVESTQLFKRSIGEVTDIVEKEMYTFTDLNGDSLTLRPEGTAGCLRACLEHGLLHNQQQKLWYLGPMFRHEKPQKGRYRQFHQLGIEALGIPCAGIEIELIALCSRFWKTLGISEHLTLEINSLGELSERQAYRERLVNFFKANYDSLDEDSRRRLERNPLRILDSKNPQMQALINEAPKLIDCLGEESQLRFKAVTEGLERLGIPYKINPVLVRGLDYYGHTVFEWVTDKLGSQATVCAGGRYDVLIEQLGGTSSAGVGIAIGIERLLLLLETLEMQKLPAKKPSLYLIATDEAAILAALKLAESLHDCDQGWLVHTNTMGGSFKSQFKKADKSGADYALILGEEEMAKGLIGVKDLRTDGSQISCTMSELINLLIDRFSAGIIAA